MALVPFAADFIHPFLPSGGGQLCGTLPLHALLRRPGRHGLPAVKQLLKMQLQLLRPPTPKPAVRDLAQIPPAKGLFSRRQRPPLGVVGQGIPDELYLVGKHKLLGELAALVPHGDQRVAVVIRHQIVGGQTHHGLRADGHNGGKLHDPLKAGIIPLRLAHGVLPPKGVLTHGGGHPLGHGDLVHPHAQSLAGRCQVGVDGLRRIALLLQLVCVLLQQGLRAVSRPLNMPLPHDALLLCKTAKFPNIRLVRLGADMVGQLPAGLVLRCHGVTAHNGV